MTMPDVLLKFYPDNHTVDYTYDMENKNGTDINNYIYAGRLYARKGPEGTVYYHQDGLGSTLAITDSAGQILNKYTYDAYGEATTIQENVYNSILFTGEMQDQSGLIYLRARYYDPATGRFLTKDTLFGELDNPLTQNLYAYCRNNPVNRIDPSGHCDNRYDKNKNNQGLYRLFPALFWLNEEEQLINQGTGNGDVSGELSDELKLMVATIYGESANCSPEAWQAIANVIMNRVGKREWSRYDTVTKVIQKSGFDAYTYPNAPYKRAVKYLNNRDGSDTKIEELIKVVVNTYNGETEDNTNGAVLYYSPNAQAALHKVDPQKYPEKPAWNFNVLQLVSVSGAENDDLRFYKYK